MQINWTLQNQYEKHKKICDEIHNLYEKKNRDYGDSIHQSFLEEGWAMFRIRLGDKMNRFRTLSKNPNIQYVKDESLRDTLVDLANYAITAILEIDSMSTQGTDIQHKVEV